VNDYKEMGLLYEAFLRPHKRVIAPHTDRSYSVDNSPNPHHSYSNIPLKDPGGSGRRFDGNMMNGDIAHVLAGDEESQVEPKEIMNVDVLDKIELLMKDAESFEQTDVLIALNELKRDILRL